MASGVFCRPGPPSVSPQSPFFEACAENSIHRINLTHSKEHCTPAYLRDRGALAYTIAFCRKPDLTFQSLMVACFDHSKLKLSLTFRHPADSLFCTSFCRLHHIANRNASEEVFCVYLVLITFSSSDMINGDGNGYNVASQPVFMPLSWSRVIIGSIGDGPKGQKNRGVGS